MLHLPITILPRTLTRQPVHARIATCIFAISLLASLATATRASAHSIVLSRGTVTVHPDHIAAEIEVDAQDLLHRYRIRATADGYDAGDIRAAADRHRLYLLDRFILRDESGERLLGRAHDFRATLPSESHVDFDAFERLKFTYSLEFPLSRPPRYLTFQQRFDDAGATMPSQLVLSIHTSAAGPPREITLTSRGNTETIDVSNTAPATAIDPLRATPLLQSPERFKSILATIHPTNDGVLVEVRIPAPLLDEFMPRPRRDADFLDGTEMASAMDAARALLADRLQVTVAGTPIPATVTAMTFIGPVADAHIFSNSPAHSLNAAPSATQFPANRRLGYWSARLAATIHYSAPAPLENFGLSWSLFSPQILSATAWLLEEGRPPAEHPLLPGAARIDWSRDTRLGEQ